MIYYQPFFSPLVAWTLALVPPIVAILFMRGRGIGRRLFVAASGPAIVFSIEFANLLDVPPFVGLFVIALCLPIAALWVHSRPQRPHL